VCADGLLNLSWGLARERATGRRAVLERAVAGLRPPTPLARGARSRVVCRMVPCAHGLSTSHTALCSA
jgi:hypothetical protein